MQGMQATVEKSRILFTSNSANGGLAHIGKPGSEIWCDASAKPCKVCDQGSRQKRGAGTL